MNQTHEQWRATHDHIFHQECEKHENRVQSAGTSTKAKLAIRDQTAKVCPNEQPVVKQAFVQFELALHECNPTIRSRVADIPLPFIEKEDFRAAPEVGERATF